MRFLPENEALKAMSLFEGAQETNKVSKAALKNWVVSNPAKISLLSFTDVFHCLESLSTMVDPEYNFKVEFSSVFR